MTGPGGRRWPLPGPLPRSLPRAPIALQLIVLLVACLVAAQLATLVLTLAFPPAPPPKYRLDQIAAALKGGPLDTGNPRALVRSSEAAPPSLQSRDWVASDSAGRELARALNAPEADVRILFYSPPPFAGTAPPPPSKARFPGGGLPGAVGAVVPLWALQAAPVFAGRAGPPPMGPPGMGPSVMGPSGMNPGGGRVVFRQPFDGTDPDGAARPARTGGRVVIVPPGPAPWRPTGTWRDAFAPGRQAVVRQGLDTSPGLPALTARTFAAAEPAPLAAAPPQPLRKTAAPTVDAPSAHRLPFAERAAARVGAAASQPAPPPVQAAQARPPVPRAAAPAPSPDGRLLEPPRTVRALFGLSPAPLIEGDFVAAYRQADGKGGERWITVRPEPQGFPSSWQQRVLLWFALSLAVVAPIGWLTARRLARPFAAFAEAAERLGRDPTAAGVAEDGPAEVAAAAAAFNRMQARIRRHIDDRTSMVGAISHDLRTPLTRMRFRAERADPELKAALLRDVGQMEEMITAVLAFIRDASEPGERARVDLRSILECVVDDAALVGGDAVLEEGEDATVEADVLGVQRVLTNLVDNALKYGGAAKVRLFTDGDEAVAQILDDGPGLPEEELERVFTPFYRGNAARSLNSGGIGLGLAVSRSIVRAHGGDIELKRRERGLMAQVRLPLARAA